MLHLQKQMQSSVAAVASSTMQGDTSQMLFTHAGQIHPLELISSWDPTGIWSLPTTTEAQGRILLCGHWRENSYCFYSFLSLMLLLPVSEEPVFQQWPVIPTADSASVPIATSSSVAMDTQTIHALVEHEREKEYVGREVSARRPDFERNAKYMASLPSYDIEHAASPANRAVKKHAEYFNECVENSFAASYAPDPGNSLPSFHHTGHMPASTTLPAYQQASGAELSLRQKCGSEHSLAMGQDNLLSWLDASKVSMGKLCTLITVSTLPINTYKHACARKLFTHTHILPSIHTLLQTASHTPTLTPTHQERWTHTMMLTLKDESCFFQSINKN